MRPRLSTRAPAVGALLIALIAVAGCQSAASGGATAAPANAPAQLATTSATSATSAQPTGGSTPAGSATASKPPTTTAAPDNANTLAGKTVVIDPGHDGGNETHIAEINQLVPQGFGQYKACDTTGTNGDDGYTEHQFNLTVALLVEKLLQQRGITVILTRTTDTGVGPCVNVRAAIGNDAHANAAVSIHADGHVGGHGYQILEADESVGGPANDARSHRLAVAMHATFDSESGLTPSTYAGVDGYEPRDDIAGLNLSTVPKILVECGNMREASDLALEESPVGRQHIAQAIADGIISFLLGGG
jgi:N-acetylmuramoyl-L-alanine amidase